MAEELPEAGEESGEPVGTGLRARAWRGGGTRLSAPCRFGGAAGRADPALGEPTEAWRVGFSERVIPETAQIAARGTGSGREGARAAKARTSKGKRRGKKPAERWPDGMWSAPVGASKADRLRAAGDFRGAELPGHPAYPG